MACNLDRALVPMVSPFFALTLAVSLVTSVLARPRPTSRSLTGLDGPLVPLARKSQPADGPWQLWYFEAVSATDKSSIQVVYYSGFAFGPLLGPDVPYYVQLSGTFANGTAWGSYMGAATTLGKVTPASTGFGSNGVWPGVGGWTSGGSANTVMYEATFNTGPGGVVGNLTMAQTAPAHYACDR